MATGIPSRRAASWAAGRVAVEVRSRVGRSSRSLVLKLAASCLLRRATDSIEPGDLGSIRGSKGMVWTLANWR